MKTKQDLIEKINEFNKTNKYYKVKINESIDHLLNNKEFLSISLNVSKMLFKIIEDFDLDKALEKISNIQNPPIIIERI